MTDSTIANDQHLILIDNWPGAANPTLAVPADGFTGTSHHNVATAKYPLGEKIQVYCKGTAKIGTKTGAAGYATFIYLKLEMQDATNVLAAKHIVTVHSDAVPYDVTNEVASDLGPSLMPIAVGLSAMTVDYYGWFWCGGVCPVDYVDALDGAYKTHGDVAIGPITCCDAASAGTTYGEIAFDLPDGDAEMIVGYSLSADAA